jgi:hypothetical protein
MSRQHFTSQEVTIGSVAVAVVGLLVALVPSLKQQTSNLIVLVTAVLVAVLPLANAIIAHASIRAGTIIPGELHEISGELSQSPPPVSIHLTPSAGLSAQDIVHIARELQGPQAGSSEPTAPFSQGDAEPTPGV